jgi:hypothetical protein
MASLMEGFEEWAHLRHHGGAPVHDAGGWSGRSEDPYAASQTPAGEPVTVRTTTHQEDPLSLSSIASDIKDAVENGDQWLKQIAETHLPAVLAVAAKYEASPIVQALESAALPPGVEAGIAGTIRELAKLYPAAPAPAEPAQQAPAA